MLETLRNYGRRIREHLKQNRRDLFVTLVLGALSTGLHAMDLYATLWWWDILTHFVSGMAVGAILYLVVTIRFERAEKATFASVLLLVLVMIGWETFEFWLGLSLPELPRPWPDDVYGNDTALDVVVSLLGTLTATEILERI